MGKPVEPVELARYEAPLRELLRSRTRAELLALIATNRAVLKPFQAVSMALWAIRAGGQDLSPSHPPAGLFSNSFIKRFEIAATNYVLADPATFEQPDGASPFQIMLRLSANQHVFDQVPSGGFGRAVCLWCALPAELKGKTKTSFDFALEFETAYGLTPFDFLRVAFTLWVASERNPTFSRQYFDDARRSGLRMPADEVIKAALKLLVGTPCELTDLFESKKGRDRRYFAYDYNPLLSFPLVRPWGPNSNEPRLDRLTAPSPSIFLHRVTYGVHYGMVDLCGKRFCDFFGELFEAYVGDILKNGHPGYRVLGEADFKAHLPKENRRVDWVIVRDDRAILIECKAIKLTRIAAATGAVDNALVVKNQLKGSLCAA